MPREPPHTFVSVLSRREKPSRAPGPDYFSTGVFCVAKVIPPRRRPPAASLLLDRFQRDGAPRRVFR